MADLLDEVFVVVLFIDEPTTDPSVRAAIISALSDLAGRNALETARFLLEFARRSDHNTHMILRGALPALPAEDQARLVQALRG